MATREENLKKINEQLELLSDEQLENVVGGCLGQTSQDMEFFSRLGFKGISFGKVGSYFSRYGISFESNVVADNVYKFQGADSYSKHPRHAALGYVLNKMNYPGYNGKWWDLDYTRKFIREHIGYEVL